MKSCLRVLSFLLVTLSLGLMLMACSNNQAGSGGNGLSLYDAQHDFLVPVAKSAKTDFFGGMQYVKTAMEWGHQNSCAFISSYKYLAVEFKSNQAGVYIAVDDKYAEDTRVFKEMPRGKFHYIDTSDIVFWKSPTAVNIGLISYPPVSDFTGNMDKVFLTNTDMAESSYQKLEIKIQENNMIKINSPQVYTVKTPVAGNYPQGLYKYPYSERYLTYEGQLYTQTLEWSPAVVKIFAANTQYTAKLTLEPAGKEHTFKGTVLEDVGNLPQDSVENITGEVSVSITCDNFTLSK
ncbi:MAG: hypothetical protein LBH43_02355 [Treponema sp.]|jgi:hypothetical protein|nr:hypothetical protein [Treponema sp.]